MSAERLKRMLAESVVTEAQRRQALRDITDNVLATSPYLIEPDFRRIHPDDLRLLYELYDELFFAGHVSRCLPASLISFRLSRRMTRVGGTTTQLRRRGATFHRRYEIAISTTLMFESFQNPEHGVRVTGLECTSRLEALMRVMEHELTHLMEFLVWDDSSCARARFQNIAHRFFGHTDHRHELITPSDTAATEFGIRPGSRVRFRLDGRVYEGVVNRITRRATVLVEDQRGTRYTDGRQYLKFYVPLRELEAVE